MPQRRKGGKPNNKKKNKGIGRRPVGALSSSSATTNPAAGGHGNASLSALLKMDEDSFSKIHRTSTDSTNKDENKYQSQQQKKKVALGGIYEAYKRATESVTGQLRELLPIKFKLEAVNDLARGADHLYEVCMNHRLADSQLENEDNEQDSANSDNDTNTDPMGGNDNDRKDHHDADRNEDSNMKSKPLIQETQQQQLPQIRIPYNLVVDLTTSIDLRIKVASKYSVDGSEETEDDKGHLHMIKVLQYCKTIVRICRRHLKKVRQQLIQTHKRTTLDANMQQTNQNDENYANRDMNKVGGRFAALQIDDEDEDEDDDTATNEEEEKEAIAILDKKERGIEAAPIQDETTERYTIADDLIKGGQRLQACAFLYTMEELMAVTAQHYQLLKSTKKENKKSHEELKLLMECAVAANTSIQSIRQMESSIAIDFPHLCTFYHILAIVFLPNIISAIEEEILKLKNLEFDGSGKSKTTTSRLYSPPTIEIVEFVGNIIECSFHNKGRMEKYHELIQNLSYRIVNKKANDPRYSTVYQKVEFYAKVVKTLTDIEVQSKMEEGLGENDVIRRMFQMSMREATGGKGDQYSGDSASHQWLQSHDYIGGTRSILNTQRWLQSIMSVSTGSKLIGKPGYFGTMWDETYYPATSIQGDLDEVFCGSILPELLEWCKPRNFRGSQNPGLLAPIAPYLTEVLPVLDMLRSYLQRPKDSPVPVSLTFAMHCLLTSIIDVQGNSAVTDLAEDARLSWYKLFEQFEEELGKETPNHYSFFVNVKQFAGLKNLPTPIGPPCSSISPTIAFFNPFMAGCYLLFANYILSISLGSVTVDSIGQLRFVLHLYNAFRQCGLLVDADNDKIVLVKQAYDTFYDSKAVWIVTNEHPKKGKLCERFLMAWGHSSKSASAIVKSEDFSSAINTKYTCREMVGILPEEFSLGYRLIVKGDFSNREADYSITNGPPPTTGDEREVFVQSIKRINMARDAIDEDDEKFGFLTNWSQVGCLFNEFTRELSKDLGWEQLLSQFIATCPDDVRYGNRSDGRRLNNKKGFSASDVNLQYQGYSNLIARFLLLELDRGSGAESMPPMVHKAAAFMKRFFSTIDDRSYTFLVQQNTDRHIVPFNGPNMSKQIRTQDELRKKSMMELRKLAFDRHIDVSGCSGKADLVGRISRALIEHVGQDDDDDAASPFIRGTSVEKSTPMARNPLDKSLHYPVHAKGTESAPFVSFLLYKFTKRMKNKVRLIKPGKLTPSHIDHQSGEGVYPYENKDPQLVPLTNGKYRHIASFSLTELRKLGWDGAMYHSKRVGTWVPFIDGYDSDEDDEYEPVAKARGMREGILGLPRQDKGKYMRINCGDRNGVYQLNK